MWLYPKRMCLKEGDGIANLSVWKLRIITVVVRGIMRATSQPHDKTNKMMCAQRRLRSSWPSLIRDFTWRKLGSLATHWEHSEDSDHTGRMCRLIWVFTGHTVILLVLWWSSSFIQVNLISSASASDVSAIFRKPEARPIISQWYKTFHKI